MTALDPSDHRRAMPDHGLPIEARPCGLGRRFLAIAYDSLVVIALLLLATAVALPLEFLGQQALRDPLLTLYLVSVWFVYEAWCWRRVGMTLGMRAWGVRLLTAEGGRPGWGRCLLRFLIGIAGTAALGAGLLWALVDARKRCWHDLAAGTWLVRTGTGSNRSPQHQYRSERQQQ